MDTIEGHKVVPPPEGVPVWDIDPYDEGVLIDPVPYYAELRRLGPFAYIPKFALLVCGRYAETKEVFSDWKRFVSSRGVGLTDFSLQSPWRSPSIVLEVDPPYHTKTRAVIAQVLSTRAVNELRTTFQSAADQLVSDLLQKKSFEAVSELAEVFPTTTFPRAVGLTAIDTRKLIDYGTMVFNALGPDNDLRRKWIARTDLTSWVGEQCRRENLSPVGFGSAIYAAVDAGSITEEEAALLVRSLLSAGLDTTVAAIGNAIWCLAKNGSAFELLKADPKLARSTFDEVLRYTSPVHSFSRTSNQSTEVSGVKIQQDTKILCVLGSANLDERHFLEAANFDIMRKPVGHLAFGQGIHGCVGQILARAELEAILTSIAKKVNEIEFESEPVWRPGNAVHALDRMPVRFKEK
jgi:cytochrome P450